MRGDVNEDGKITASDYVIIKDYIKCLLANVINMEYFMIWKILLKHIKEK